MDSEDFKDKLKIADKNFQNETYAGYISAMRKASKTSTREMAQIAGCTPEEYCAYEQERKIFDPEVYEKCEKYLKDVKGRSIADLYAELCMPETNCIE